MWICAAVLFYLGVYMIQSFEEIALQTWVNIETKLYCYNLYKIGNNQV